MSGGARKRPGVHRQRGISLLWVLLVLVLASLAGAAMAYLVMTRVDLELMLRDQPATVIVPEPITATASVNGPIGLRLNDTIGTTVPINQSVTIPIRDTLNIVAYFKGSVPLKMNVRLVDEIALNQVVAVDTTIDAYLPALKSTIQVPIRGKIPINTTVPVDLVIPVDQMVDLDFTTPVTAQIDQQLTVPLMTQIDAAVPIDADMNVPVLNDLHAVINMPAGPSKVVITEADLSLPLRTLKLGLVDEHQADQR
ncbi:MAG: hypothetical protein ACPGZP_10560 [Panacagrimonas sp.]